MPSVVYSKGKGLVQKGVGSGFQVNDVAILEEVQALSDPSSATVNPYGTTTLTITGTSSAAIAAPTAKQPAGVKKVITMIARSGGICTITLTGGGIRVDGATGSNTVTFNAVGETYVMVSNGSKWVGVANAGATEAS